MKDHGTFTTAAQFETWITSHNVSSGKPTDIMVGDYFTVSTSSKNYTVYVAGINTEYQKGKTHLYTNHIVCVCNVGNSAMNSTSTTADGYNGATVMQTFLDNKATDLSTIFGSHLLSRSVRLSNAVGSSGKASASTWYTKKLTLMTEIQLTGGLIYANIHDIGEGSSKLPIFNDISPLQLFGLTYIWLRTVINTGQFGSLNYNGIVEGNGASLDISAPAVFCLG